MQIRFASRCWKGTGDKRSLHKPKALRIIPSRTRSVPKKDNRTYNSLGLQDVQQGKQNPPVLMFCSQCAIQRA